MSMNTILPLSLIACAAALCSGCSPASASKEVKPVEVKTTGKSAAEVVEKKPLSEQEMREGSFKAIVSGVPFSVNLKLQMIKDNPSSKSAYAAERDIKTIVKECPDIRYDDKLHIVLITLKTIGHKLGQLAIALESQETLTAEYLPPNLQNEIDECFSSLEKDIQSIQEFVDNKPETTLRPALPKNPKTSPQSSTGQAP